MKGPGPFTREAARAAGVTGRELRGFHRVRRGHYVGADVATGIDAAAQHRLSVFAAAGTTSSQAVVSYVSAAIVHGLPVWGIPLAQVHITRDRHGGGRVRPGLVVHSGKIAFDEVVVVDGIRVTTVARTVIDLARTVPFERAVVLGDSALRLGLTSEAELTDQLARAAGLSGCPAARRVTGFLDGRSESVGESRSRVRLLDSGLPMPRPQANIHDAAGSWVARVDFLWSDLALVGEFDGLAKYRSPELRRGRSPEEIVIAEKTREDALRALGLQVIRWTWRDLNQPDHWLRRLRQVAATPRPSGPKGWK